MITADFNKSGYAVLHTGRGLLDFTWSEKDLIPIYRKDPPRYIAYLSTCAKTVGIQKLFFNERIQRALSSLGVKSPSTPSLPVLHIMSPNLMIPDGYNGTTPHQDWSSVQGSLGMVTVWIALTDINNDNYPLEVIAGSHLEGLRDGWESSNVFESEVRDGEKFTSLECKAGDVVFMSGFLVHRTGLGKTFRAAVSQRFDNASEPSFIERGYPCAQKRVVNRELVWEPTVEEVRGMYAVD